MWVGQKPDSGPDRVYSCRLVEVSNISRVSTYSTDTRYLNTVSVPLVHIGLVIVSCAVKEALIRTQETCELQLAVHAERGARLGLVDGGQPLLDLEDVRAAPVEHHALVLRRAKCE